MVQLVARPARIANSTTRRFKTGSTPGMPRPTGQTLVLGGAPKAAEHPQKIFARVSSSACTSSPMTASSPSCVQLMRPPSRDGAPAVPVAGLLVGGARAEHGALVEGLPDHLEA